ncbi:MAG: PIN domain-containing protein [Limnospira sp. PMC 1291.21]|uniref:PIN domain-containing protein n=2 Tax=Limnospira fusiformis TaxID=54297 RepID=A0ABU9EK37_LIMFS|nr:MULTISPECIES: PIN domain-containing protein [Limnospira]MDY7052940.1 PIN domain-containing protein [Limnospira fusiformis LS22]QJB29522.1 PIN domain-containing protein [Limnospira fusiformis SAG 85.79]MDT9177707.1 PIN domain-containing protein [Limnospira sp. PMC 1238.20]MDT9186435.1 PIN domain-containing protein [Limnospira sp. PMC 894.15]MDT9194772.1 PIN domain-containing protein [Limnospira sp. PMC 1245.20]
MVSTEQTKRYLDTNILVYSIDLSRENRPKHRAALEILRPGRLEILCLSSQVVAEFYSVVTGSKSVAHPLTPQETISRIERFMQMPNIEFLSMSDEVFQQWLELLKIHPVSGARVFDLMHLAIMQCHQVESIYTFNADDFNWQTEIKVIIPSA